MSVDQESCCGLQNLNFILEVPDTIVPEMKQLKSVVGFKVVIN